ncbi:FIST N-terminal domain-containing protein [Methanotorris formicicus]|uniref:Transcriptional regulator, TrmB n=1 Tax=Methanotorris formicicus Mc-S-70 TaxID=647171 RepID=H1KWA1_9EURY|nr:FIST N-terminal domain-containing protein [Methanotorris formicicus]EHP89684.1 transcriptional regulator, TrmB [Methanotorris formicicus Mc-S-70]
MILLTSLTKKEDIVELINGLKSKIDVSKLIGCTTAGEFSEWKFTQNGALLIVFDEHYKIAIECKKFDSNDDPRDFGMSLARDALKKLKDISPKISLDETLVGFLFFDWNSDNENEIIEGISNILSGIPIVGGTSGDCFKFERTFLIYQGKVLENSVVKAIGTCPKKMEIIYGHGYKPTQYYARVTKANGKVVYELDGKPAFQVYAKMISDHTKIPYEEIVKKFKPQNFKNLDLALLYPLGVHDTCGNYHIKFLESVEGDTLVLMHEVKEGTFLVMMETTPENTKKSREKVIERIKNKFKNPIIFVVDCACRWVIESSIDGKICRVQTNSESKFPKNPLLNIKESLWGPYGIGFLSYGESVIKGILSYHNTLTFVGLVIDSSDERVDWREELKYFEFSNDEVEVISLLMDKKLTVREILEKVSISQTKLYQILNELESRGIIRSDEGKPKKFYIDNLKEVLERIHLELENQYRFKKKKREELLSKL